MIKINENLLSLINQNQFIPEEDKETWHIVIEGLPENFVRDIFDFLNSYPDKAGILTDNLKEKMGAIRNQDIDKFESLLNNDKQFLDMLKK